MRVAEVTEFGGPEVLRVAERPDPDPAAGEVVVRIDAFNVNPTDLVSRSGAARRRMPGLEPPFVPGWDLAGEVTAAEPGSGYAPGDAVVGMIPWVRIGGRVGAYAEAAAVKPDWLAPAPAGLEATLAATLPLNALTAQQGLELLAVEPGSTLLVTGASGAVGGFATQLAAAAGLRVLAVASEGDEEWVDRLGAKEVLPRSTDIATLAPVDALFDAVPVGPSAAAAVREGGAALFTRGVEESEVKDGVRVETLLADSDPDALRELSAELEAGRLRTRVADVLDLGDAAEAHRRVEAGGLRGKLVLTP
jgi:NADPH:quinone reductase-like Zn-dependent oxidoreductase